jgi:succinate dehydrogenase/fumarate reductase flavoprotein subunit
MRNKKIDLYEELCKVSCDILVIGRGGAGIRAAIEAHDSGADVLIISKSQKGDPHTVLATGGINGALPPPPRYKMAIIMTDILWLVGWLLLLLT